MENTIPKYFRPSILKFTLLSIITLGGYKIYWAYRNFDAIKAHDKATFSATWQAILFIFFIRQLFKRMTADLQGEKSRAVTRNDILASLYIALAVLAIVLVKFILKDQLLLKTVIGSFSSLVSFAILIYFQLTVFKGNNVPFNNRTARGEVIVVIFFALPLFLALLGLVSKYDKETEKFPVRTDRPLNVIIE